MKNTKQSQLSEHFSLREMTASGTAMQLNIDNTPDEAQTECLRNLCQQVLEPLRKRFGVIRVTSGFRSKRLNNAVGGVICSQHLLGEAADLHISNREVGRKMYDYIRNNLDFDQLLFEHRMANGCIWLHVSYTKRHPNHRRCDGRDDPLVLRSVREPVHPGRCAGLLPRGSSDARHCAGAHGSPDADHGDSR